MAMPESSARSYQDALWQERRRKPILTAEHIVGTYRMQEEPKLTAIPHFLVAAVVELPGGAKPGICYPEYTSVDWDEHKSLSASCQSWRSQAVCRKDAGREGLRVEYGKDYGKPEMMAAAIIREIRDGDVVFHGLASSTPMVAMKAAKALGKDFTYVTLSDGVDHDWTSPPTSASTLTANTYLGSVATFGLGEIFDLFCSGKGDIAFLSCLQMDKEGRIAMSYLGGDYDHPKLRGPGGAGSATLTPVTPRTTIWKTTHDKRTFVEHVDFATTKPALDKLFTVITPLCIFRKPPGEKFLRLDSIFPYTTLEEVRRIPDGRLGRLKSRSWILPANRNWLLSGG